MWRVNLRTQNKRFWNKREEKRKDTRATKTKVEEIILELNDSTKEDTGVKAKNK